MPLKPITNPSSTSHHAGKTHPEAFKGGIASAMFNPASATFNPEGTETTQLLAHQLAASLARARFNGQLSKPLLFTCEQVLQALAQGEMALNMAHAESSPFESVKQWKHWLVEHALAEEVPVSSASDTEIPKIRFTPFIVQGDWCFLGRHFQYQQQLTRQFSLRAQEKGVAAEHYAQFLPIAQQELARLFADPATSSATASTIDWQQVAAAVALLQELCVISGGPGTGKTTTVIRLLAALVATQQQLNLPPLRIGLAAPTGKAAARMEESIRKQLHTVNTTKEIQQQLAVSASTLHRLLGYVPNSSRFRHHARNPLALDVLVVDESSMIDSVMMAKVLDALSPHARLILLGDKDQLPPVDAGSPFADICQALGISQTFADTLSPMLSAPLPKEAIAAKPKPLGNHIVMLHHSYRFGEHSPIGQLARAVNNNDYRSAFNLMTTPTNTDSSDTIEAAHWQPYSAADYRRNLRSPNKLMENPLALRIQQAWQGYREQLNTLTRVTSDKQRSELWSLFQGFCLLTAVHQGAHGREAINRLAEEALQFPSDERWYHGRPIMVTQNDYQTGLYNGDVGLCFRGEDGQLRVAFPTTEGFMLIMPSRVPAHETAFAITVHKSQGSEFEKVLFLLPNVPSRILSRALVYTAITRAKKVIEVWGDEAVWGAIG